MDDGIDGEPLHQPAELFRRKLTELLRVPRPGEMTALDTLVQEKKAVAFPEQAFDLRSRAAAEQEQRIWHEQLLVEPAFDNGRE